MPSEQLLSIFISHRHSDKRIADVLASSINDWSNREIKITQASHPSHGLRYGEGLVEQLKAALLDTNLVILIYTFPDKDWSWVTWEGGFALGAKDPNSNRLIVLQCGDDVPGPFLDKVSVHITEDGIFKFVRDFHKDKKFFPPTNRAYAPNVTDEILKKRSEKLFEGLKDVVKLERPEERRRWDMLCISLGMEQVNKIVDREKQVGFDDCMKFAREEIMNHSTIANTFGEAQKHFDYATIENDVDLKSMVQRWERWNENAGSPNPRGWIDSLLKEMTRAITKRESEPMWHLLKSARADVDWWFIPVVNHTRILHNEDRMEFDLYFYRINLKNGQVTLPDKIM
jgi:hypothetical protein